jgi:hypothetical protein
MKKKLTIIVISFIFLVIAGVLFKYCSFFGAFAPAKVVITKKYISTNRSFINGVTIEKIRVDSIGADQLPAKYTVTYLASCHIIHPDDRPPEPPAKIWFNREGKYWWNEEHVNIPFIHERFSRRSIDTTGRLPRSFGTEKFKTCPLTFQNDQWYFFTISDPQIVGVFFHIDKEGNTRYYRMESGVSPI